MNEIDSLFVIIASIVRMVPQVAVVIACLYYFSKKSAADSALLAIGSGINLFVSIFYQVAQIGILGSMSDISIYFSVFSGIQFFASMMFGIGFIILILNTVKKISEE